MSNTIEKLFDSSLAIAQQPAWPDRDKLAQVVTELRTLPPLVFAGECDNLKIQARLSGYKVAIALKLLLLQLPIP
jgi:3-deoxy-D-arabino-heptulosonate 7-phosphate (DAHP) synthase class II